MSCLVLLNLNRLVEAHTEYSIAISLEPSQYVYWNNRANLHFQCDRFLEAIGDYTRGKRTAAGYGSTFVRVYLFECLLNQLVKKDS